MPHVHVNDVELFYEESGTGEPLVVVHGGWSDHRNWQAVFAGLAESFRVIAYDRRGHGRSGHGAGQGSRRDQEDDLAALIEALDCAPAHLAGNSFGASIAIGLAARRPELIRAVAAHEPPVISLVAGDPDVQEVQATIGSVLGQLERGDVEGGTRKFIEEVALGPGAWEQLPVELREIALPAAPAFVREQRDPHWAHVDPVALSRLTVPSS